MKNPIPRSLQKPILLIFLFFSLVSVVNAQDDVEVDVTNVIVRLDGTVDDGNIHISKNFIGTLYIEIFPPTGGNGGFCASANVTLDLNDVGHNCPVFTQPMSCAGKWCFKMTKDNDTECIVEFCVTVQRCIEVKNKWQEGVFCPESAPTPDDHATYFTSNQANESIQYQKEGKQETSLQEQEKLPSLLINKIYPNPFFDRIIIDVDAKKEDKIKVELFDLLGRSYRSQTFEIEEGEDLLEFSITENLPSGNYFIRITNEHGVNYFHKLVHIN